MSRARLKFFGEHVDLADTEGLDTLPLPGDVSVEQLRRILGDVAALAWKWKKPLSARLQPVWGKKAGDTTEFESQYLFNTTLHQTP